MPAEKIIEAPRPETPAQAPRPERLSRPEKSAETAAARSAEKPREKIQPDAPGIPDGIAASAASDWQKRRADAIDSILSEGLNDIFLKMDAGQQKAFQQKGEETVSKINELLNHTKVKITKIIKLIRDWLKMIPGINKFFLEQEIKIKTDKIMKIKDKL